MRTLTKLAAAFAVALPLIGAGVGTAQARDSVTFGVTVGTYGSGYSDVRYGRDYGHHRTLPPGVIRDQLSRTYYEVSNLDRRGDVYVARAEDRRGRDLRITVNAYTGDVIDVSYTRHDRDRGDDRHDRWDGRR